MANYFFETMSESDASAFTSDDRLFFLSGSPSSVTVTHAAAVTGGLHPVGESITITSGVVSHTFSAEDLAAASQDQNVIFVSAGNDALVVDSDAPTPIDLSAGADVGDYSDHSVLYAFGGNDTIDGGNHSDWIDGGAGNDVITAGVNDGSDEALANKTDVLQGGVGADTITGDIGNDHIYGNAQTSTQGAADLGDSIVAGAGNDYVNGNAGADTIFGDAGNDRLYGGADADTIHGGADNDYLQGNKGADSLLGDAGNDVLHGGADNDALLGGADNDQLFGDLGADTVSGEAGYDTLWGGAGNDTFSFGATDASNANVGTTGANADVTDVIADFTNGGDKIHLAFVPTAVLHDTTGTVATTAIGAEHIAQGLLTGTTNSVAAVTVGSDTYLFFDGDGSSGTIDSVIKVLGVTDSAFNVGTNPDFV